MGSETTINTRNSIPKWRKPCQCVNCDWYRCILVFQPCSMPPQV